VDRYAGKEEGIPPESEKQLSKEFPPLVPRRIHVSESAIEDVLKAIGKTLPEHELNCGSCGYDTCRDKAQAVVEGKANLTMCLPYLKEKAESFSDTVIKNMPTSIVVVNERYEVQLINQAALRAFTPSLPGEILGGQVVRILDPLPFYTCKPEQGKHLRQAGLPGRYTASTWSRRSSMTRTTALSSVLCAT
jgi:hypothetical protein